MASIEENLLKCEIRHFNQLNTRELYEILKARVDVFIVEQDCPYSELDGKDQECYHLMGFDSNGELVAVTRIAPVEVIYPEVSIGRVITTQSGRGKKYGKVIMEKSIDFCREQLKAPSIKIAAQLYLKKFYESFGFEQISEVYPWDGIDHIDMRVRF